MLKIVSKHTTSEAIIMQLSEIFKTYEIRQRPIVAEIGYKGNCTLVNWRRINASLQTMTPVIEALIVRGKNLLTTGATTEEILIAIETNNFRLSWVAKQLNISRQALWEHFQRGLSEERAKEIQQLLHKTGREIIQKASKLKKGTIH